MGRERPSTQDEIDRLRLKIFRMYTREERAMDIVFGALLFIVIFGIGFTFGYFHSMR